MNKRGGSRRQCVPQQRRRACRAEQADNDEHRFVFIKPKFEMRVKIGLDVFIKVCEAFEDLLPKTGGFALVVLVEL